MASEVDIWNRALQKLGAKRVVSATEDSVNARECAACYDVLRDSLIESHSWSFSIERFALAADAVAPAWGRANSFQLPAGCLGVVPPYPEDNSPYRDWVIESGKVLTNESAPLYVRCKMQVTDVNRMHTLFREALSCLMAFEMCEKLTQSNSKKESLREDLNKAIANAKKRSAIESVPVQPPEDTWVTGRA